MHIDVYYNKEAHVSRLLTGFHMLEASGKVRSVTFHENTGNQRNTPHPQVVEAVINGTIIAFDMCDAYGLGTPKGREYLTRVALYFKRSYDPALDKDLTKEEQDKVRPFGFDYYATFSGNPIDQPSGLRSKLLSALRKYTGYNRFMHIDAFEGSADRTDSPSILFMTRLWDPSEISLSGDLAPDVRAYREYMIEERHKINADRIRLIRTLKERYGKAFFGGIQDSPFAQTQCPDLILPKKLVCKRAYLTRMKNSDICIGSMGLHRSTGWKTGEYVAAARAIVAERFTYQVPGDFEENRNYIPYDTPEECLDAVERLFHDPEAIYQMKLANQQYYQNYLRPDIQIQNALDQCF